MKVVLSTLHQKIKFLTLDGIGEIIGDQTLAQECYFLKPKGKQEAPYRVSMKKLKLNVLKDLEEVLLYQGRPERIVKIGTKMDS